MSDSPHDGHDHDHDHDHHEGEDEDADPRLTAGWAALEKGDVAAALAAAREVLAEPGEGDGDGEGDGEGTGGTAVEALMLQAAAEREQGEIAAAIDTLGRALKADPEWCTPELWLAELLALDEDNLGEALRHARKALDLAEEEDEYLSALTLKAGIELDLGRRTEARRTLRGLPAADVLLEDPAMTMEVAELLLEAGDAAEARTRLETLVAVEKEWGDAWYLLGATAEQMDDEEGKRAAWVKVRALDLIEEEADGAGEGQGDDGEPAIAPLKLTEEALVATAEAALAELPEELRGLMANVPVIVADVPAAADVAAGLDPRLLGLFHGTPHGERGGFGEPASLTEIVLFRRNIQRIAADDEALREEVRTTLLHEAGHFFGLDEAALARLGLD